MKFCPQCETHPRMKPKADGMLVCPKCGLKTKKDEDSVEQQGSSARVMTAAAAGSSSSSFPSSGVSLKVMDEKDDGVDALPTTNMECPECKNNTAFWWMLQTRSADEATTQFFRCTKCNHTWRNYA